MAARNNGLSDRMHSDATCESAAAILLGAARCVHATRVDVRTLYERAGIEVDPRAPSGCRGLSPRHREPEDVVRISLRGDIVEILATLAHEGGHLALCRFLAVGASADASGVHSRSELQRDRAAARTHGEGDATRVAQAFAFPRYAVQRALALRGWDIAEVVAICPTMPVLWAILRLAWVAERGVIVTPPRARIPVVWAPENIVLPPWDAWVGETRRLSKAQRAPTGVEVVSYVDDRDETWTVSVLPPAHEDASWLRLHAILRVV